MSHGGAGDLDPTAKVIIDQESGQLVAVKGDVAGEKYEVIGPLIQAVFIHDHEGHVASICEEGRLRTVDSSGLPHLFPTDAAGADTYTVIGVVPHFATKLLFHLDTKDAILSFDGGTTDHLFLGNSKDQLLISGLAIEKGAIISAKNQTAGQNYANLSISVW